LFNLKRAVNTVIHQNRIAHDSQQEERQLKTLAMQEYDWLATVIERSCLVLFLATFLLMTVSIVASGFYHWINAVVT
jgi:hypothetical protein